MTTHQQYAALPWIDLPSGRHVLLVTSRDSGRWLIPKGWPMKARRGHEVAEMEAFEEAGVSGEVDLRPCGNYTYRKKLHFFTHVICSVDVFPLHVTQQRLRWRERHQRRLQWFPLKEAAALVREPELAAIFASFDPGHSANSVDAA